MYHVMEMSIFRLRYALPVQMNYMCVHQIHLNAIWLVFKF